MPFPGLTFKLLIHWAAGFLPGAKGAASLRFSYPGKSSFIPSSSGGWWPAGSTNQPQPEQRSQPLFSTYQKSKLVVQSVCSQISLWVGGRLPARDQQGSIAFLHEKLPCHHTLRKRKERQAEVASAGAGNTVGTADKILSVHSRGLHPKIGWVFLPPSWT